MTPALIALTREVSPRIIECELTHLARAPIDVAAARAQHAAYERALEQLGCEVRRVTAAPELPDSVFIEDTAVVVDEVAIIARPGAASRRDEVDAVAGALAPLRPLVRIVAPGTLDGGDVLVVGRRVLVGRTERTNDEGITQLRAALAPFGYTTEAHAVTGCLHLKSAVTALDDRTVLCNPAWLDPSTLAPLSVITVDPGEPMAANIVRVGPALLYADAYPRTRAKLAAAGYAPVLVDASEVAKAEGAVTCCSIILNAAAPRLHERWDATWRALGQPAGDPARLDDLLARYREPHRAYHTLQHLGECLSHWQRVRARATRAGEAELALWYHDAVHDPQRTDNEMLSAALARDAATAARLGADVAARVESMILDTRHEAEPTSSDGRLVVDVDLAILGADEARFDEYERQVREEYAWVPAFIYGRKRAQVLQRFLDRPQIYASPEMRAWGEARARVNLQRSLARLR